MMKAEVCFNAFLEVFQKTALVGNLPFILIVVAAVTIKT